MAQGQDQSVVIAYYRNPKTGKVERYEMASVTYDEASRPMMVGRERVVSGEEELWALDPPEDVDPREIVDHTPQPFVLETPPAQPPPAFPTRSPQILKRTPAPAAPTHTRPSAPRRG
jgi:hypothetical protein